MKGLSLLRQSGLSGSSSTVHDHLHRNLQFSVGMGQLQTPEILSSMTMGQINKYSQRTGIPNEVIVRQHFLGGKQKLSVTLYHQSGIAPTVSGDHDIALQHRASFRQIRVFCIEDILLHHIFHPLFLAGLQQEFLQILFRPHISGQSPIDQLILSVLSGQQSAKAGGIK